MNLRAKRYFHLWVSLTLVLAVALLGLGSQRIIAYTFSASESSAQAAELETSATGKDISNPVALFDNTLVHSIQILISDEDYQEMITTYQQTGVKEYFHADVIIDGVMIENVGLRLKGNASLRTAVGSSTERRQAGGGFERGQFNPENVPDLANPPEGFDPDERPQPPEGGVVPQPGEAGNALPQGGSQQSNPVGTGKIPLMIKFDEFVSGQTYQGNTALAIRTYGTSYDAAMLQEPVTIAMARLAGIPASSTAYAGVAVNNEHEELYVISELINQAYIEKYFTNTNGVLYKAELGSTLSYQGEDPSAYADSFTQQTRVNDADLAPLIRLIKFLAESDDATFEKELPDYLDVDSFATYLALNTLLVNTDSIIGMNNNYYLYYDDVTGQFTLLMWDTNESLGKLGMGSAGATYSLDLAAGQSSQVGGMGGFGRGEGIMGGANTLLSRFMAIESFKALYEEKLQSVYQKVFLSGAITGQVDAYASLVRSALEDRSLVDATAYEAAVTKTMEFITQRADYLASTPLLSGVIGTE